MAEMYTVLQRQMKERRINASELAEIIGKSPSYVSTRFSGAQPWTMDDAYKIMEVMGINAKHISKLFPPRGLYAGELEEGPSKAERLLEAIQAALRD